MGRKRAEEEPEAEEAPAGPKLSEAEEEEEAPEKVSKMEAVRRLLADDPDMKPGEGVEAVKARFGLEMDKSNFSAYKSQIRAGGKQADKPAPKQKAAAPTAAPAKTSKLADPLEAARAVKELVDRFGASTVKGLADLFGSSSHG